MLHLLAVNQKQQCVNNSEHYLRLFQCNEKVFLCKYVTMDETCIHHFALESNRQSAPTLFSRSGPCNYWLLADLKRMLQGKRYCSNEEVISETEAYFEAKDTTILEHQNNKQKLQILEAIHIRNIQPKLNRINFEISA